MADTLYIGKNPKGATELIKKFNADPDSNSGIVTVPKVIGAGENITIPSGRVAVLPNVQVEGTLNIEGEVFIPSGSAIDMGNGLAINGERVVMSVPTSYHLLQGNLAVDNTTVQINNALIPIAKGLGINGLKNVMLSKNEAITGLTYTLGKNYIYCDGNGSYGVKAIAPNYGTNNPANGGDFYNILENKWYTSAGIEIPEGRNYLNHIVHADNDGGVLYVEELPKIEYKDVIKANEYQGKNACTAWVNFDGTTTPPTIKDSYNVSSVIRTGMGAYDVYFKEPMDSINYGVFGTSNNSGSAYGSYVVSGAPTGSANDGKFVNKVTIGIFNTNTVYNPISASIQIIGGKN